MTTLGEENQNRKWPRIAVAAALLLLPLIYFLPVLVWKLTLVPGDGLTQNLGVRVLIGQMIASGQVPLWNPYIFAGTPLLASIYPGALYPPNWVFALFSPATAMNIVVITTYHLTLIGAYLYARRIGATRIGALVTGLAFTFGGYMVAHAGHTSRIAAAAWLPWILLAIENLYLRFSWRWIALGAVFIALQLFAGEPQMNFYTVLVGGAYGMFSLTVREQQEKRGRFLAAAAVMSVCGLLLSMIQLLPERELLRMGERAGISYEYFSAYSFPPKQILNFVFPFFFGGATLEPFKIKYWGQSTPDETCGYVGLLTLLLALVALFGTRYGTGSGSDRASAESVSGSQRGRYRSRYCNKALIWFWLGVAVVSLALSFGGFLPFGLNHLLYRLPVYNLFRASARHMYEFTFSLAVLAGLGASYLAQADREKAKRAFKLAAAAFAAIIAVTMIVYRFLTGSMNAEAAKTPGFNSLTNPEVLVPLGFALLSLVAVWFYAGRRIGAVLLVVVLFADLMVFTLAFNWGWRNFLSGVSERLKDSPSVQFIKSRERDLNSFRIVTYAVWPFGDNYDKLNFPNVSIARGLQSANGYDALRLLRQSEVSGHMESDGLISDNTVFGPDQQGFNLLNVKYLLRERPADPEDWYTVKHEGVQFLDTPLTLKLKAGASLKIAASAVATQLALITTMTDSPHIADGEPVARVKLHTADGRVFEHEIQAGRDTAEWAYDRPDVKAAIKHARAPVAESWDGGGFQAHRYLVRFNFDRAEIERIEFTYPREDKANLLIVRASLLDAGTGKSAALEGLQLPPERWRRLGTFDQIEVYENLEAMPRAWFVRQLGVATSGEVLTAIKTGKLSSDGKEGGEFNPAEMALFEKEDFGNRPVALPEIGDPLGAQVKTLRYEPNRIEIETHNSKPGFLVLSEIYYRGWDAWIDGQRVPVERVNYALRGVAVPAGDHRIEFVFRSPSFRKGAAYSLLGVLLLLAGAVAGRVGGGKSLEKAATRLRGLTRAQLWVIGMLLLLAIYTAVLAKHASYAVGGSDSSGYANLARSLLQGSVTRAIPELDQFDLPASQAQLFTPLAYLPRLEGGAPTKRMVAFYPVGFPIHLAVAAMILGWQSGPYLVSPLLGALSLLFLYLIGLQLGLSRAFAFAGALILAANPTFIFMVLQPMSDVTALFWALVMVWAGLRSRQNDKWALLAGAAFGAAFLVRPTNVLLLSPLAFCLRLKPKVILLFVIGGLPLAAIFFAYNFAAFGNLLQTGYGAISLQEFVTTSGFLIRFKHYLFWLMMTMSPLLLVGWAGVAADRRVKWCDRALLIAWFGAFITFYACYSIYDAWWYTRFLLPAYPALILGALLTTRGLLGRFSEKHRQFRWAAGLALLGVALGFAWYYDREFEVFRVGKEQAIHAESCRWAGARLPAQSVVVASEMSGALKFFTDHLILRWDSLPPEAWPPLKNRVQERGYQFYALLMPHEIDKARQRVPGIWSEQGRLRNISLWRIQPLDRPPPIVNYASGFFDPERDEQGRQWRWMSDEGVVELENTGRTMRLLIKGDVPVNVLPRPATIKIVLNGQVLAQVEAEEAAFRKELIITPAQQGSGKWSELRLGTNQVFVPNQLDPRSSDQRRLGFSLTKLTWEE